MDLSRLQSLTGFEALTPSALRLAAARTRWVRLPARRWLVRPGRVLSDHYYLLEGRVRLLQGGRRTEVTAGSLRAREPVYPGAPGLETLTPALFAGIHPGVLAELGDSVRSVPGFPEVRAGDDSWERRFLGTPVMRCLSPQAWQRLLRAMTRHDYRAGDRILVAGEPADCCYVLHSGRAEVLAPETGARLARLRPGDLFGEDALVTGSVRNASVLMTAPGAAMSLPAACFEQWLLEAVVRPLRRLGGRRPVSVDPEPGGLLPSLPMVELRTAVRRLPRGLRYAIIGGAEGERLLASFLLIRRGIDARPLVL